jgi:Basic tilted helix bundle domain
MAATSQCHVTAVLLCMGRGGDPNAFRPNRDESQWWSRRDALVRCVASFLFGPSSRGSKDMILLFDDDRARIYLSLDGTASHAFPCEQMILALFKKAAQSRGTTISKGGLSCRVVLPDPTLVNNNSNNSKSSGSSELPTGLDSKRDLLEYLQKHCSIEFLRSNGLNSAAAVILRKTNKLALMDIWHKWQKEGKTQKSQSKETTTKHLTVSSSDATVIESLFSELIASTLQLGPPEKSIVGTLHETCEEFPCFFDSKEEGDAGTLTKFRVMLFLGAVR